MQSKLLPNHTATQASAGPCCLYEIKAPEKKRKPSKRCRAKARNLLSQQTGARLGRPDSAVDGVR